MALADNFRYSAGTGPNDKSFDREKFLEALASDANRLETDKERMARRRTWEEVVTDDSRYQTGPWVGAEPQPCGECKRLADQLATAQAGTRDLFAEFERRIREHDITTRHLVDSQKDNLELRKNNHELRAQIDKMIKDVEDRLIVLRTPDPQDEQRTPRFKFKHIAIDDAEPV